MRRGRNKAKKRTPNAIQEVRKSATPIVVICHSDWTGTSQHKHKIDSFCSKTGQWQVFVHNPDTNKWWDRLQNNARVRNGPPNGGLSHAIVVYREEHLHHGNNNNNNNDNDDNRMMHNAIKLLGESTEIATVALMNEPNGAKEELEAALPVSGTVVTVSNNIDLATSYMELRQLWAIHDAHDQPQTRLQFHQVTQVCQEWPSLMWRWNGPRLRNLYQRLRYENIENKREEDADNSSAPVVDDELEDDEKLKLSEFSHLYQLRRDFEEKAASLLANPETQRVADFVLCGGATRDENLFGRLHSWALASIPRGRDDTKYIIVASKKKKDDTILNAYDYATCNCTKTLDQLKMVTKSERPKEEFSIPVTSNAMITVSLIPALFPTGTVYEGTGTNTNQFDVVLGSRRVWEEHMALKASIIYLFQGQPGPLWDLAMHVVKSALPKTWDLLLLGETPDEVFLRALLHPDVVEAGRLLRLNEDGTQLLPSHFQFMSRIYALGRFVRTLDKPDILMKDMAVRREVASTMKVQQEQVDAIVRSCESGPLSSEACAKIFGIKSPAENEKGRSSKAMSQETMEVLGMLGLFLNRDRKSLRDSSRIESFAFDVQTYKTTMALADCAMYCGTIRWLSEDDADEEGIWTCSPCLHRWQKRGQAREAYQTRKLMHPMTLTPFSREEYYDHKEWDNIMEATNGDISKLGIDFYWGRCSTEGCGKVCRAVARSGACAETDGVPLDDFPETVILNDGYGDKVQLRHSLATLAPLGENNMVTTDSLEKYFDSEEKLMYLAGPIRRRVRNCIDKSTYILPRGLLCDTCGAVPENSIDEYCPYCGTGFEPVFACVHYSCPQCGKHFCKACLGIDGIHFNGVYSATNHACWRLLGNRYAYHNKGYCSECQKERPWPKSHALVSAGPEIRKKALSYTEGAGMPIERAIELQSSNLKAFTERYEEGVSIFESCSHTVGLGPDYCHCGANVHADDDLSL